MSAPCCTHQSTESETVPSVPSPSSSIAFATSKSTPFAIPSKPPSETIIPVMAVPWPSSSYGSSIPLIESLQPLNSTPRKSGWPRSTPESTTQTTTPSPFSSASDSLFAPIRSMYSICQDSSADDGLSITKPSSPFHR